TSPLPVVWLLLPSLAVSSVPASTNRVAHRDVPFCRSSGPAYIKSNAQGINRPSPRPAAHPVDSAVLRAAAFR
ncbi:hypothetical protein F5883DRAFT_583345, partial [Diaporthe sp. PMI_573]